MRAASMRPLEGPVGTSSLAAGGGLEVPGGDADAMAALEETPGLLRPEPIPGERDASTATHRAPGAIGGQFAGADTPSPRQADWLDEETAFEHAREGGGGAVTRHERDERES
jgi:hypothetical protein